MTIDTQKPFNMPEFLQGYTAALAKIDRPREETINRPDVDYIVEAIRDNPDNTNQILDAAQTKWHEMGRYGRADGNTRNLYRVQLELVVAKLARQDGTMETDTPDLDTGDTREAIRSTLS